MANHPRRSARRGREEVMVVELRGGEIVAESDSGKAWLFRYGVNQKWLPKSQCQWDPDTLTMTLPEWLADKEGLEP